MTDMILTARQVSVMFGVTARTVNEWIKADKLKATKIGKGNWQIQESAVKELAEKMYGDRR